MDCCSITEHYFLGKYMFLISKRFDKADSE